MATIANLSQIWTTNSTSNPFEHRLTGHKLRIGILKKCFLAINCVSVTFVMVLLYFWLEMHVMYNVKVDARFSPAHMAVGLSLPVVVFWQILGVFGAMKENILLICLYSLLWNALNGSLLFLSLCHFVKVAYICAYFPSQLGPIYWIILLLVQFFNLSTMWFLLELIWLRQLVLYRFVLRHKDAEVAIMTKGKKKMRETKKDDENVKFEKVKIESKFKI